jgi:hypothetical protein
MSGTRPQVMSWLRIISRDDLQLQSGCAFRAESRLVSSLPLNPSASQLQYGPILSQFWRTGSTIGVAIRLGWAVSTADASYLDEPLSEEEIRSIKEVNYQNYRLRFTFPLGAHQGPKLEQHENG